MNAFEALDRYWKRIDGIHERMKRVYARRADRLSFFAFRRFQAGYLGQIRNVNRDLMETCDYLLACDRALR